MLHLGAIRCLDKQVPAAALKDQKPKWTSAGLGRCHVAMYSFGVQLPVDLIILPSFKLIPTMVLLFVASAINFVLV